MNHRLTEEETLLAESLAYLVIGRFERVILQFKGSDRRVTIGDFYGYARDGLISPDESYCVMAGCGVIVYYLREPFEAYRCSCGQERPTEQWKEFFRDPPEERWIGRVTSGSRNHTVRFAHKATGYELDVDTQQLVELPPHEADLEGALLADEDLKGADLAGGRLAGADLDRADLTGANLAGTDLRGARFFGADLTGAQLQGARLAGAVYDLATRWPAGCDPKARGAVRLMPGDNLQGVALEGASLQRVDLSGARLDGANLRSANLHGANLGRAVLTGARLKGACLRASSVSGADFTGCDLSEVDLDGAEYDEATRWPDGFDPREHGARRVVTIVSGNAIEVRCV